MPTFMVNFGYPYNDLVICKDSTDYLIYLLLLSDSFVNSQEWTISRSVQDLKLVTHILINGFVLKPDNSFFLKLFFCGSE